MKTGSLMEAARRDRRTAVTATAFFLGLCVLVLGWNWKFVYNFVTGPQAFDAAAAARPGAREWFRAEGAVLPSGLTEETRVRMLRGAVDTQFKTANYLLMLAGDKFLLVKVRPEFSGRVADGRLEALPAEVMTQLPAAKGQAFHPWLLDATQSYRTSTNLFMWVAGPLTPLFLLLFVRALWLARAPERHKSLQRLAGKGPLPALMQRVERDCAAAGAAGRIGPFWITPAWIVTLEPSLHVWPTEDLMGVGVRSKIEKEGSEAKHRVELWTRGELFSELIDVSTGEAQAVLDRVGTALPWAVVEDPHVFEGRWTKDRNAVARDVDMQRTAARSAAPATA